MVHNWKDNLIHFFQKFNIVWGHITQINSGTGFPISNWCFSRDSFVLEHFAMTWFMLGHSKTIILKCEIDLKALIWVGIY
jgi:hypothetical protein